MKMTAWYLKCNSDTTPRQAAILKAADSHCTPHTTDRALAALVIRGAGDDRDFAIRAFAETRRGWLDYQARTQRKWQGETRRPSRARHHDSISIRERYVRCSLA